MTPPVPLDHAHNAYLTLVFSPSSPYLSSPPASLRPHDLPPTIHHLAHVSQVGELKDSHVYQVEFETDAGPLTNHPSARLDPKKEFDRVKDQVVDSLKRQQGVDRVMVLAEPRMRAKRVTDEL